MKFTNLFLIPLVLLIVIKCGNIADTAGGSTDTGNARISASVYMSDGTYASGARVIIRRSDYLSGRQSLNTEKLLFKKEIIVDQYGNFQIDSVDTGSYSIEINDRVSEACLLNCSVRPGEKKIELGSNTIYPYAVIEGIAAIPADISGPVSIRIYGLERDIPLDSSGHFIIKDLPAGDFRFIITADDTSFTPLSVENVKLVSGTITEIPFTGWKFQQYLFLNTSSSGADITSTVYDFPVVVRLSNNNFNFSHASGNGTDLRFTSSNGKSLQYEIERWDSAGGSGIIWVRVDTILGNTTEQYILMHSGFTDAGSGSNGASVFDTANGFQGVWHLDDAGIMAAKDATGNSYDGTLYNMTPASSVSGAIGGARDFDGVSSYIAMTRTADSKLNFPQNGYYTISAWVYVDTFDTKWHVIAGKGHEQYYVKVKCFDVDSALWEFDEYEDKTGWALTEVSNPPNSKSWVYLVGMRSGPLQQLYVNGVLALDTFAIQPGTISRNTSDDFSIGKYLRAVTVPANEGFCAFDGKIDEVCVSSKPRSADWIKLCYMNQRPDDKLVFFK